MQVRIRESSQAGEARREAVAQAVALGFGEERAGRVALVVTELATNLLKHAPGGGEIFLSGIEHGGCRGVEIVALDRGPGLDAGRALRDGYSTAGSAGTGLGAVSRLSDEFELDARPESGTVALARIWAGARPDGCGRLAVGGVCSALDGETVSGDAFAVADHGASTRIVVADGLGHGPDAHAAAAEAVRAFRAAPGPLTGVLEAIHGALRPTRGAAVAVAEIDAAARTVRYAGIGNVAGAIVGRDSTRNLVSHNGTAGHAVRRVQEFAYDLPEEALLVLHTDGLRSRWSLDAYGGLARRDPVVVAATLYRDFQRGRDDATVVVARPT